MRSTIKITALALAMVSSYAMATAVTYSLNGNSGNTQATNGYIGLSWDLDSHTTVPKLVLGVFSTSVQSNGNTEGADLSIRLNMQDHFAPTEVKASYLNGTNNLQGELGLGYDFRKNAPLLGLGVNAPYANVGVDATSLKDYNPFLIIHSQDQFQKPTTSCTRIPGASGQYSDPNCVIPFNPI